MPIPPMIPTQPFHQVAPTPPMGWNSWDCFGTAVTELQVKANADYMADRLLKHGYQYVVIDIQWYEPNSAGHGYREGAKLTLDANGRLLPAGNKFPSAAGGHGFKPLADYVHAKGLKFGLHLMRGIPRQAVEHNLPVLGTNATAQDIADKTATCPWNPDMYGVNMSTPAAQAYYNSVFRLLASWDVDFVKVDDLSRPYVPHQPEIEAIRRAIDASGRPMVLSMSPGETALVSAVHAANHANMWRISDDFWDSWPLLKSQFARCSAWAPYTGFGHWPDADMLPVGELRSAHHDWTKFSHDEQITMLTLWSMARSPLMIGANLPANDGFTLSLLTNDEVLAVNQHSHGGRQLQRDDHSVVWFANGDGQSKYVALFNTDDAPASGTENGALVSVTLADLGLGDRCHVRDLWQRRDLGEHDGRLSATVPWHGAVLVRVDPSR